MELGELMLLAVGLSMDAFAVSVCKGLGMRKLNMRVAAVLGVFFGGFQALMPVIGWALGSQFLWLIAPVDHWIAFVLLGYIGGKMLWDAAHDEGDGDCDSANGNEADTEAASGNGHEESNMICEAASSHDAARIDLKEFFMLAIATSIDALAVGISLAALSVNIVAAASFIGVITFGFTLAGVAIGHFFGARYQKPATIIGGCVLIFIGAKVLVQHLFL